VSGGLGRLRGRPDAHAVAHGGPASAPGRLDRDREKRLDDGALLPSVRSSHAAAAEFSGREIAALITTIVTINAWNRIIASIRTYEVGSYQP
jgi:hypothetical protein